MSVLIHEVGGTEDPNVHTWKWLRCGQCRLFYQFQEIGSGFTFYALAWCQSEGCLTEEEQWSHESTEVEIVVKGVAYFDGLRHIYFNPEREGYIYYADSRSIMSIFAALRLLEEKLCTGIDK